MGTFNLVRAHWVSILTLVSVGREDVACGCFAAQCRLADLSAITQYGDMTMLSSNSVKAGPTFYRYSTEVSLDL
jgi:hypothetical protein